MSPLSSSLSRHSVFLLVFCTILVLHAIRPVPLLSSTTTYRHSTATTRHKQDTRDGCDTRSSTEKCPTARFAASVRLFTTGSTGMKTATRLSWRSVPMPTSSGNRSQWKSRAAKTPPVRRTAGRSHCAPAHPACCSCVWSSCVAILPLPVFLKPYFVWYVLQSKKRHGRTERRTGAVSCSSSSFGQQADTSQPPWGLC